jgi:hypothetical protein
MRASRSTARRIRGSSSIELPRFWAAGRTRDLGLECSAKRAACVFRDRAGTSGYFFWVMMFGHEHLESRARGAGLPLESVWKGTKIWN